MMNMTPTFRSFAFTTMVALSLTLVSGALPAQAANEPGTLGGTLSSGLRSAAPVELSKGEINLLAVISRIISSLIGLLGALLFAYLLYGGFLWTTAGGDTKKVGTAKDVIKNAIIGIVIVALAYSIGNFVINELGKATTKVESGTTPPG